MPPATIPFARRPEVMLGDPSTDGQCVVQDLNSGDAFQMGAQEAFLLSRLDGRQSAFDLCTAFHERFGEPLSEAELEEFLALVQGQGLVKTAGPERQKATSPQDERDYIERFADSERLFRRGQQVIAGATTHDRREFGPFPLFVDRADGPYKWDVTGRRFIDTWMGHGALLCGHNHPPVVAATLRQLQRGTHYGACHELEVRWAELVCEMIPCAERVRFTASGTEATQLAIRVARAYTGRPVVLRFDGHFHGWHDEAMVHFYPRVAAGFSPGAPFNVALAPDSALDVVKAHLATEQVAAVLLEPAGGSGGGTRWSREFLQGLREATRAHGTLLIFDEVISGFRHSPGGVQQVTGVTPDVTTLAKILSGGLPGGAVVGRADVMAVFGQGTKIGDRTAKVPHTGTFNGNPLSAAAGIAMLESIADDRAQEKARDNAARLCDRVNAAADAEGVDVFLYNNDSSIYHILIGPHQAGAPLGPSMAIKTLNTAHPERYELLRRALLLEGLDTHPIHGWVSSLHDGEVLDGAAEAFGRAFRRLRTVDGFQR